ncbi:MAG: hypothetical protein AAF604_05465 [Acidobacteriota bacterium]
MSNRSSPADRLSPPWSITFADGNGNRLRFWLAPGDDSPRFTYRPITPENSSSGVYSGGTPRRGSLSNSQSDELMRAVLELESATANHAPARRKGTGAFILVEGDEAERRFLIQSGERLRRFEQLLESYRS